MSRLTPKEAYFNYTGRLQMDIQLMEEKLGHDADNVQRMEGDLEQEFIRDQLIWIMDKLSDVNYRMKYLSKEVSSEGRIYHNSAGRYEFEDGNYVTSGSSIELLLENNGEKYWVLTSIEHNGNDYYAVYLGKDHDIKGMYARIRR